MWHHGSRLEHLATAAILTCVIGIGTGYVNGTADRKKLLEELQARRQAVAQKVDPEEERIALLREIGERAIYVITSDSEHVPIIRAVDPCVKGLLAGRGELCIRLLATVPPLARARLYEGAFSPLGPISATNDSHFEKVTHICQPFPNLDTSARNLVRTIVSWKSSSTSEEWWTATGRYCQEHLDHSEVGWWAYNGLIDFLVKDPLHQFTWTADSMIIAPKSWAVYEVEIAYHAASEGVQLTDYARGDNRWAGQRLLQAIADHTH